MNKPLAGTISGSHINKQAEKDYKERRRKWIKDAIEAICKDLFPEFDHIEWKEEQ